MSTDSKNPRALARGAVKFSKQFAWRGAQAAADGARKVREK